jgi:hypothetical protein
MKIPIAEAARRLRLHPCELVLEIAQIATSFDDLYPEVDEGVVETLKQMHPELFVKPSRAIDRATEVSFQPFPRFSKDAEDIVYALSRKKHWGTNTVPEATLKNHYCRDLQNFDYAVKELLRVGILTSERPHGPFSLNPKAKVQVDAVIRKMTESLRNK